MSRVIEIELTGWARRRSREVGDARETMHQKYCLEEHRPGAFGDPDRHYRSLLGEWAVGEFLGLPVDWSLRPEGDGGADFQVPGGPSIDCKTAQKPWYLLREQRPTTAHGKVADILVLASITDWDFSVVMHGWERDRVMTVQPVRQFGGGFKGPCHFRHATHLRGMPELLWEIDKYPFVRTQNTPPDHSG